MYGNTTEGKPDSPEKTLTHISDVKSRPSESMEVRFMKKEDVIPENRFVVTGRITSYSEPHNGKTVYTILTRSGREASIRVTADTNPAVAKHQRVIAKGHIEKVRVWRKGKLYIEQRFVADSLTREKTLVEQVFPQYNIKGHFSGEPEFHYYLTGTVIKYDESNGYLHTTVRTKTPEGQAVGINISMKTPERLKKIQPGDMITAICGVFTMKKGYETLTAEDIGKIDTDDTKATA